MASSPTASAASHRRLATLPSFGTCSVSHRIVCESSRRVIEFPGEKAQSAIFVVVVVDRADDIADDLERAFGGAPQRLWLLAHGDDLHLRLAALGDGDGL